MDKGAKGQQIQPEHAGAVDLVAMASTMFSIFYGVWWGTLLSTVSQKSGEMGSNGNDLYHTWITDSTYLVAKLIVLLTVHALVVAHLKVMPRSSAQLLAEVTLVLVLAWAAFEVSASFLNSTVETFDLDGSVSSSGKDLLRVWLWATWGLVVLRHLYMSTRSPIGRAYRNTRDILLKERHDE